MAHITLTNITVGVDVIENAGLKVYRGWCLPNDNGKKYRSAEVTLNDIHRLISMLTGVIGGSRRHPLVPKVRGPRGPYKKRKLENFD
jgi:hypothetical protein